MEQIFVPPRRSPTHSHGEHLATEPQHNQLGRQPFFQLTEPQKAQLESTFFGLSAGASGAICGAILTMEQHDYVTLGAFGCFAVLTVLCCSGIAACFAGLNRWEDDVTRVARYQQDRIDILREELRSAKRGADAGSAGRGTRASYPLPAEVIRFPGDWRA